MVTLAFIIEIFFTAAEAAIILFIYCLLSGNKFFPFSNRVNSGIFILLYTVFTCLVTYFNPFDSHTVFVVIFGVLYLSFITKTALLSSLSVWILMVSFMTVVELVAMICAVIITGHNFSELMQYSNIVMVCTIAVKIIETIATYVAYRFNVDRYLNFRIFRSPSHYPSLVLVQAFLLGVMIASANYIASRPLQLKFYNVLLLSIYILHILLTLIYYYNQERLWSLRNKYSVQQEHITNIEAIISIIRKEKHDFSNHLNTIYGLCSLNKPDMADKIKKYISSISAKPYFSNKSVDTGNDYIDALIAVKNNFAIDTGVCLKTDFRSKLNLVDLDEKDLVAVFGNMIDNAFDALLSTANIPERYISITTFVIDKNYYISMKNNGPAILERNLPRIFTKGFSTKNRDKSERGYGLFIVNQIVAKAGGYIHVSSNVDETEFLIKLKSKREDHEENSQKAS